MATKIKCRRRLHARLCHTCQAFPPRSRSCDAQAGALESSSSLCDDNHCWLPRLSQRWAKSRLRRDTHLLAGDGINHGPTVLCVELSAQAIRIGAAANCLRRFYCVRDGCDRTLGASKRAQRRRAETRDAVSYGNYCVIRAALLMVFLLAGLLPLFHTTAGNLLLNNRKLSSLRNVVGRLTGRDVCDQLRDLFAFVINWTRRVLLAAHSRSGTKENSSIRDVV